MEDKTERRTFLKTLALLSLASAVEGPGTGNAQTPAARAKKSSEYTVAAYYFGNYHIDPRNEQAHGPGWTEWRLVQNARSRFPGHAQPKVPLWGYENEADPLVFAKKITAAAEAGIDAFIFDWYYYNDGAFLERALERGYLGAKNKKQLKFALMWANHDWYDIHPAKFNGHPYLQFPGEVTTETFDRLSAYVVDKYFAEPSYWKIDGRPYFSIYELYRFVKGCGGVKAASQCLQRFRKKAQDAGFPDLHLNAITWGVKLLPGQTDVPDLRALLQELGIDSTTSYVWIHHAELRDFPVTQYADVQAAYEKYRGGAAAQLSRPYFPNVSVGWDSTPRTCVTDSFTRGDYPYIPVVQGNTPLAFRNALRSAKDFADTQPDSTPKIITLNSWNEWTEGSYLEPDTRNKYTYLDQVRDVFGSGG
jgi:Glycosyltransferase WbsX